MESPRKFRREVIVPVALVVGIVLVSLWFPRTRDLIPVGGSNHPLVGKEAPPLKFENTLGKKADLKGMAGKVLLINFWAVWCGPCLEEMPSLATLEKHFGNQGLEVLAFNVEEEEDFQTKLKNLQMPNQLIVHFDRDQLRPYGVSAIPLSLILDKKGIVRNVIAGPRDWMSIESLREIEALVKE